MVTNVASSGGGVNSAPPNSLAGFQDNFAEGERKAKSEK